MLSKAGELKLTPVLLQNHKLKVDYHFISILLEVRK